VEACPDFTSREASDSRGAYDNFKLAENEVLIKYTWIFMEH